MGAVLIMLYIPASIVIGIGFYELTKLKFKKLYQIWPLYYSWLLQFLSLFKELWTSKKHAFLFPRDDIQAMDWINNNIPSNSVIGIKPFFWQIDYPHGIDSGLWIPYFTGIRTNMGTMLYRLSSEDYQEKVIYQSTLLADLL